MSFKSLMIIKAFTGLFFGIGLLFMPGKLFLVFGAELNTAGMFPAREYASALTGIFFLCWFARNVTASDAR